MASVDKLCAEAIIHHAVSTTTGQTAIHPAWAVRMAARLQIRNASIKGHPQNHNNQVPGSFLVASRWAFFILQKSLLEVKKGPRQPRIDPKVRSQTQELHQEQNVATYHRTPQQSFAGTFPLSFPPWWSPSTITEHVIVLGCVPVPCRTKRPCRQVKNRSHVWNGLF